MNYKHITYIFLVVIAIVGYNAFLIKRDAELMKAYDSKVAIEKLKQRPSGIISSKDTYCNQQAGWHPDCNVE